MKGLFSRRTINISGMKPLGIAGRRGQTEFASSTRVQRKDVEAEGANMLAQQYHQVWAGRATSRWCREQDGELPHKNDSNIAEHICQNLKGLNKNACHRLLFRMLLIL